MTNTDFNSATVARSAALGQLADFAQTVGAADTLMDMLGRLRLVELFADQARRAIATEARASGFTWSEIGDACGLTKQGAQQRFGGSV